MASHYHCGQFEDAYRATKMRIWETKELLAPPKLPPKTASADEWRQRPVTAIVVDGYGHLINRKSKTSSFNTIPDHGTRGSTIDRWPPHGELILTSSLL